MTATLDVPALVRRQREPAPDDATTSTLERLAVQGDLSKLSPQERVQYYGGVCRTLGVNPLTQPFAYLQLGGRTVLYATRACTDQLRAIHNVTIEIISRERIDDVYIVTARATRPTAGPPGSTRSDEEIGAVSIAGLKGEALANALMKTSTKAKRRATLAICGLGWMDELEVDTVPGARVVRVDQATGELLPSVPNGPVIYDDTEDERDDDVVLEEDPKPLPKDSQRRELIALAHWLREPIPKPRTESEAAMVIEAMTQRKAKREGSQQSQLLEATDVGGGNERY